MSVKLKRQLQKTEQVDHVNNVKTDDRIENLQILTLAENAIKGRKRLVTCDLVCATCGKIFKRRKGNVGVNKGYGSKSKNYCSRKCVYTGLKKKYCEEPNNGPVINIGT